MNSLIATANSLWADERKRVIPIILGALTIAILFAFWKGLGNLWFRWGAQEELSHSYFLPLVAGWMLWERRHSLLPSLGAPALTGFVPAFGGLFLLFLGELTHIFVLEHLGFVVLLISLPLILGGWSLLWVTIIPLAYLFFMVPPPYWVITVLSGKFQLMSSELGVAMIRLFDVPVYLSGNVIHLSSTTLAVVEACSGLRYLFPFLSLGALAAYFYKGPLWQRIAIFLSTIPITILMNSFRIAMTGVVVEKFGGSPSEGFLHYFEGWVVFLLCILFLMAVIWVFTLFRGQKSPLAFVGFEDVPPVAAKAPWDLSKFVRHGVALTLLVLSVGVIIHTTGNRALIIPERQLLFSLPLEFPE
ncbi:MAG: exosortase, partial [Pseudomonadota bacterium]